jgi:hypothetical protein
MNEKEGGSLREGTNKKIKDYSHLSEPSSETKLAMLRFMNKRALPRMIEEERRKQIEGEDCGRTRPGEKEG